MGIRRFVSRAPRVRNAMASAAVAVTLLLFVAGLPLLDRAVPALYPLPAGVAYLVGAGIEFVPPGGALLDRSRSRPGRDQALAVLLTDGRAVRWLILVTPYDGSLAGAVARLRSRLATSTGAKLDATPHAVHTGAGVDGRSGTYVPDRADSEDVIVDEGVAAAVPPPGGEPADSRLGRYAVFVIGGRAVEVTAVGPAPAVRRAAAEFTRATATLAERR